MNNIKCPHCGGELRYFSECNIEYDENGQAIDDHNLGNHWVECSECERNSNDNMGFRPLLDKFLNNL